MERAILTADPGIFGGDVRQDRERKQLRAGLPMPTTPAATSSRPASPVRAVSSATKPDAITTEATMNPRFLLMGSIRRYRRSPRYLVDSTKRKVLATFRKKSLTGVDSAW